MAETLRDFLIGYGFEVDETSRQQAESAVRRSETNTTNLTDAEAAKRERIRKRENERQDRSERESTKKTRERREVAFGDYEKALLRFTGISAAIGAVTSLTVAGIFSSVQKVAGGLEQLQYAGQRAGSTPKNLTAFAYGISQLGGSVEGASSSLADFGNRLAMNPQGYEQVLQKLGVRTRDTAGQMRDSAELAQDALQALGKRPINEARNYAETLGFDDTTRRAGADPRLPGEVEQRRTEQTRIGFDPNKAAEDATTFEQSRRHLTAVLDDVATRIETILIEKLQPQLDRLAKWVADHGHAITDTAQRVSDALGQIATSFAESGAFQAAVKSITGGLESFAKYVSSDNFSKDVKEFTDAMGRLAKAVVVVLRYFNLIPGVQTPAAATVAAGAGTDAGSGLDARRESLLPFMRATMRGRSDIPDETVRKHWDKLNGFRASGGGPSSLNRQGQRDNAAAISDELRKAGLPDEGIAAALGSMQTESTFNTRAHNDVAGGHDGIIQWDSTRWPKIERWIKEQGGNPYDPRWQARAFIAEGRARPGEWLYDSPRTQRGFKALEQSKGNMDLANSGMVDIERFGPDEEGGRAANANLWKKNLPPPPAPKPDPAPDKAPPSPRLPPGAVAWGEDSKHRPVPIAADGHALTMTGKPTALAYPLGVTPSIAHSVDNSTTKGDTHVTHNPTFNITGIKDAGNALQTAKLAAGRGMQDLLRDIQGSNQ